MPEYFAALTIVLLMGTVIARILMLKSQGIQAFYFGKNDKKDFLIPPFVLFYFYLIFANTFNLPPVTRHTFFNSDILEWTGVLFCGAALLFLFFSMISFKKSFRVGIDTKNPDQLITTGAFNISRNPIYVAFISILIGQFLIFPNWLILLYLIGGTMLIHRQVLREEKFMKKQYANEYLNYCSRVRRYL